ncbi:MAG: class D beta-lactamase [Bacteroidetes bacterium]|nr:class D beta-lactamase [Bacteroidota bacterium]
MRLWILFFCVVTSVFFSCTVSNNVKEDNSLAPFFSPNGVNGCFAIMNNATGQFTTYNLSRYRDSSYSPASTFKIIHSLIGLQTGVISGDSMVIQWDGVTRAIPEWNKNLTMYEAFRVSAVPYYQEVARRIGKDTLNVWLDSLKYGLKSAKDTFRIRTAVDSFWLDNSVKVTPDEQLGIIKRLYFNQLPFYKSYQESVKRAMFQESNTKYRMGYKTGLGQTENGNQLGWVVGWIEENNHPYFFVLNVEPSDQTLDLASVRLKMLTDILDHLGFRKGER